MVLVFRSISVNCKLLKFPILKTIRENITNVHAFSVIFSNVTKEFKKSLTSYENQAKVYLIDEHPPFKGGPPFHPPLKKGGPPFFKGGPVTGSRGYGFGPLFCSSSRRFWSIFFI